MQKTNFSLKFTAAKGNKRVMKNTCNIAIINLSLQATFLSLFRIKGQHESANSLNANYVSNRLIYISLPTAYPFSGKIP